MIKQNIPLPLELLRIIYQYSLSPINTDIESAQEIAIATASDTLTIDHIIHNEEEEDWIARIALEQDVIARPDIVSMSWTTTGINVITESELYWGDY